MRNYFLVDINKERLQEDGVVFVEMDIDSRAGVVIDEDNISHALEVLQVEVVAEHTTSYEGIVRVELKKIESVSSPVVAVADYDEHWDGDNADEFKVVTEQILLPVVQKSIFLHVPHKRTHAPVDSDFHIWIWSSSDGPDNIKPPAEMWGVRVECRDEGYAPTGQGVPIYDDSNWPVAEIIGENNLYIFHDICHHGTKRELQIYRRLLEEVVAELTLTPEQKEERQRQLAEEKRRRSRELYIQECSKRLRKTLEGTRKKIFDGEREIEELQKRLVRKIREVTGARRKLEQLQSCQNGELERYGKEFDKLLEVPKVVDVQVAPGVIKVSTDTLYCQDPRSGRLHEIGAFRIEIYTDNGKLRWYNLTRQVDGYWKKSQAPHINGEGEACLGTMAEIIPELVANYEFAALVMVAIQFVESVNTDDAAGKYIDRWPLAPFELQPPEVQEELKQGGE